LALDTAKLAIDDPLPKDTSPSPQQEPENQQV